MLDVGKKKKKCARETFSTYFSAAPLTLSYIFHKTFKDHKSLKEIKKNK